MSTSPTPAEGPVPPPHPDLAGEPGHTPGSPSGPGLPPGLAPLTESDPHQIGIFRLVGRIGAGGMGVVYAALDPGGTCIALKTVHAKYADRPGHREAFAREVQMLRRADGISTARLHGADPSAPVPWLAFDYVPGRDLNRHVREFGPLSGDMLRTFALGMAEGLATLHSAGIAHRDIKPGNVILAPDGPKIVDFGIAVEIGTDPEQDASASYGTPGWSAPERYAGAAADPAADVFAWGGLVTLAATGRAPFGAGSPVELAARVQSGDHDVEGVPEDLLSLVERALSVSAPDRPSAVDLLTELLPPVTVETELHAGAVPDRTRTQRVLRGMLADYWRGVDSAGHDPARWAAALGTASAVGLGVVGAGTLGSGVAGSGAAGAGAAGAGAASGMATAGTAGGAVSATGGVTSMAAGAGAGAGAGAAGSGGVLGALTGVKGAVAVLGALTLVGGAAATGAWYLRDDAPVEQTVAAEEPEEDDRLAVDRDPEDIEAVVTEAIDIALEASSFTTYEIFFTNDVGHDPSTQYRYTEDPQPALSRHWFVGPTAGGTLALGPNLDETVRINTVQGPTFSDHEFTYHRPGPDAEPAESARAEWETLLRLMEELLSGDAEVTYEGQSTVLEAGEESYYPGELVGDVDPQERGGHHYTGTLTHEMGWTGTVQATDFELWISDQGEPVRLALTAPDEEGRTAEFGELLTFYHHIDFFRFNEPVEVYVPEESEIQP
ncbi:serine/threonine-protein kinase [Nocardiopsis metallicus]|nr:serine/threonine-protein kinase [Nocardiopsis metallicus]